jgi:RNA polymerase sigma factor (sigma-70 family)
MDVGMALEQDAVGMTLAFDDVFREHYDGVVRVAALVAGDAGTGQERAQEAFLRLYQRWDTMTSEEHARNFVFRVAINLARSHLRKFRRIVPSGLRHADDVPARAGSQPEAWLTVVAALAKLPARQRACVVLVDYADHDSEAVARMLGISANTVRVHLMRGRASLRADLGLEPKDDLT